jgi:hypothetical protein
VKPETNPTSRGEKDEHHEQRKSNSSYGKVRSSKISGEIDKFRNAQDHAFFDLLSNWSAKPI